MVLADITNAENSRQSSKLNTSALAEKLHTKALQQENLLLRAEIEELRAAAVAEPRTPRRGLCSAPSTPRCPTTPRQATGASRDPRSAPSPRIARQASAPSLAAPRRVAAKSAGPQAATPRPASWGPAKAAKVSPRTTAQAAPNQAASGQTSRAAWANALWEQRRRIELAFEAMAATRQRLKERQGVRDEAQRRASALQRDLVEATTGHPDRIQSLKESAEGAAEGLQAAQDALQQEEDETEDLRKKVLKEEEALEELRGQLRCLEARSLQERQLRKQHMQREEALRSAIEGAQAEQEGRKALLAESGLILQKLNNEVLSLKGNIRVFCRLRPRLAQETQDAVRLDLSEQQLTVYGMPQLNVTGLSEQTRSWSFDFDHIFRPEASQAEVFEEISLLVQSALDGYRVAILAYGQTGSGKTHTMLGPEEAEDPGVLPRTVELIFKEVEQLKRNGWEFEVSASMAEVYNESVVDLIAKGGLPSTGDGPPSDRPGDGPARRVVRDAQAMYQLLKRANRERHVASTSANERSSRSHAVIQLALVGKCTVPGMQREVSGLLSFVDLAGSERLAQTSATGDRLKEAQHINRSLCALGDVIEAICRKGSLRGPAAAAVHVPYRNSRLTMLLRDSLGGDSKTLMFANISPLQEHLGETLSSLRFASKVHACCIGLAKRHVVEAEEAR